MDLNHTLKVLDDELKMIRWNKGRVEHPNPVRQAELDGCLAGMRIAIKIVLGDDPKIHEMLANMIGLS